MRILASTIPSALFDLARQYMSSESSFSLAEVHSHLVTQGHVLMMGINAIENTHRIIAERVTRKVVDELIGADRLRQVCRGVWVSQRPRPEIRCRDKVKLLTVRQIPLQYRDAAEVGVGVVESVCATGALSVRYRKQPGVKEPFSVRVNSRIVALVEARPETIMRYGAIPIPRALFELAQQRMLEMPSFTPAEMREYLALHGREDLLSVTGVESNHLLIAERVMRKVAGDLAEAGKLQKTKRGLWMKKVLPPMPKRGRVARIIDAERVHPAELRELVKDTKGVVGNLYGDGTVMIRYRKQPGIEKSFSAVTATDNVQMLSNKP